MTIKYYDEAEAETLFQTTFVEWASWDIGQYKGCYSAAETEDAIKAAELWSIKSPTACAVMNFVKNSTKVIHLVGMRGGYQCFNSTEGADSNMPVVFVDLDGKLTVNIRGPHNIHLDPSQCVGNSYVLDNQIALLHELGHAKQWIETPSMFDNLETPKNVKLPKYGGGQFDARLKKSEFATAIRDRAHNHTCPKCGEWVDLDPHTKMMLNPKRDLNKAPKALHICGGQQSSDAADIPSSEEVLKYNSKTNPSGYRPPVWGTKIEMDNMSRHEWPICKDLEIEPRTNYRDINGKSDGDPSVTSQIRRMAEIERTKNETLKVKILKPGHIKCPHCNFTKSRMFVNNHIRLSHPGKPLLS